MKRFCHYYRSRFVLILMTFLLVTGLPSAKKGWSVDPSDFELKLYPAEGQYKYQLDEPIKLIIVLSNAELLAVYTKRGLELHQALIISDLVPPRTEYNLQKAPVVHAMLPPFPWKRVTGWKEAQALELPLSETINDLRELHPLILRKAGWYTIKARLELFLFDRVGEHPERGLLGLANTDDNWLTIETKEGDEIQIFISPGFGAKLQAQVLDGESKPLAGVSVRVFKNSDIPDGYELKDIWLNIAPVLGGITNFQGRTDWTSGGLCQSRGEYSVIAYHQGEYRDAPIADADDGWGIECSGLIAKTITFGEAAPATIDDLAARAKSGKVQLTWSPTDVVSYNVFRGTTTGGPYSLIASTTSTYSTYLDTTVTNGVTYFYVVKPVDQNGDELSQSNEASATPQARRR